MNGQWLKDAHTLGVLEAISSEENVSQRRLAGTLGVALGLANSYVKRCVRMGWVKVTHAPGNRYLYYLTPKGMVEKSRLTGKYLSLSMSFYRKAAHSCRDAFEACLAGDWQNIALVGTSELTEIALVRSRELAVSIIGILDYERQDEERFLGHAVFREIQQFSRCDAWIMCDMSNTIKTYKRLSLEVGEDRVIVPTIIDWRRTQ